MAVIEEVTKTPVAPLVGVGLVTVGRVVSAVVVNDHLFVAIVLPARSCILAVEGDKVML